MEETNETIRQIGESIEAHVQKEYSQNIRNKAIARVHCTLTDNYGRAHTKNCWIVNGDIYQAGYDTRDITGAVASHSVGGYMALVDDGNPITKNSKLGEILLKNHSGIHKYKVRDLYKKRVYHEKDVEIYNRSNYSPSYYGVSELEIRLAENDTYLRYQRLSDLLDAIRAEEDQIRKKQEELKRLEEERLKIARELEEKKAKEEQERLEALRRQKEEEERKARETIEILERRKAEKLEKEKTVRSFMRMNVMLRSQHLLDAYQEDAKRSHIYDGVPIVIEGGPGTGKTTTMIQRLKFLLSFEALTEYEAPLSEKQIAELTDRTKADSHWLFFSPTEMLLQYLRENMREEGLIANDRNTRTIAKFRNKVMREYGLFNPAKEGPFKDFKLSEGDEVLIHKPAKAIRDFELYIIEYCNKVFSQRCETDTSAHIWHKDAISIKARCQNSGNLKDINGLMNLFNSLKDNEQVNVKKWSEELRNKLKISAIKLQVEVLKDEKAVEKLKALFEKWRKERRGLEEPDDEDAIVDDEEEEEVSFSRQDFENQLFQELQNLLKQLGLKKYDGKIKISKRNQEKLEIIKDYINEEDLDIAYIGSLALFVRNYASLCRGIESNIIGIVPRMYKAFRKEQLDKYLYRTDLLKKVITKDGNKHLHPDEQNLVIGFINEMLHRIYKKSRIRFDNLKHKYLQGFKSNVKNVIGIDEATDYSLLDYYFMVSFRHYEFSSITLCGDLMQGLNVNGVTNWEMIRNFNLPNIEVKSLNISYRQLPTLLDMARELYHDDLGEYPSYHSEMEKAENEPKPIMLISDDEWEKARWISDRIIDTTRHYDGQLPSVAIFVGDEVDITEFIDRITDLGILDSIGVEDCSGNRQLQNKEVVRVFRLSEVKGMEFEVAFFYDIDQAIVSQNHQLMRRYLYVGISRATSHLAATMTSNGNSDIAKYFETDNVFWEV